jgi:hypothetical protein
MKLSDEVTVIVDDSCGYPSGHKGVVTGVNYEDGIVVYIVDDGYGYSEEELRLTMEPKVESKDENPMSIQDVQREHIAVLESRIRTLETELLDVYRSIHRTTKAPSA